MKQVTFEIEQFLAAMPESPAKKAAIQKEKSTLRKAWNGLRSNGFEPVYIGYVLQYCEDFLKSPSALAVTGARSVPTYDEMVWEIEEYA
jgi:hypothetical protein